MTWYVYLTAPVSRLAAVIDLDPAVVDSPERIAAVAEQARPGNGDSVLDHLKDLPRGFALPIRGVREHEGHRCPAHRHPRRLPPTPGLHPDLPQPVPAG
ncbi:hypothetical protein [Streptomyces specialis]|uniref:hypothetical protein n=1 Tax=Streptomyces specialis TaxID=498367 RepID=UPI00073F1B5D|nr:hypothetical protein [Streptomyces specialis]